MEFKEYLVTFFIKKPNQQEPTCIDYIIEAISKHHALGLGFGILFGDTEKYNNREDLIDDYTIEVDINGKYEYI